MTPLLEQFLSEAREFLQSIGERLMQLEHAPGDTALMTDLFRFVHTLKGNSGLFEFPEMTRVLHAAEDLMDAVRNGRVPYSRELADRLLDAMDFVAALCDEVETGVQLGSQHAGDAVRLADSLRRFLESDAGDRSDSALAEVGTGVIQDSVVGSPLAARGGYALPLADIPEALRMEAFRMSAGGAEYFWLHYRPDEGCFFSGEDPLHLVRTAPGLIWGSTTAREPWPKLMDMDAYRCCLAFSLLIQSDDATICEHFRYVPDQITITPLAPLAFVIPQGEHNGEQRHHDFVDEASALLKAHQVEHVLHAAQSLLDRLNPDLWVASALRWLVLLIECDPANLPALQALVLAIKDAKPLNWQQLSASDSVKTPSQHDLTEHTGTSPDAVELAEPERVLLQSIVGTQRDIIALPIETSWHLGRLSAAGMALEGCLHALGKAHLCPSLRAALSLAQDELSTVALLAWFDQHLAPLQRSPDGEAAAPDAELPIAVATTAGEKTPSDGLVQPSGDAETEQKFGRRAEDATQAVKSLKVDQAKIDRLMNLIGEIVVAKNGLPYLASRAENVFGVRDLSREIKAQYAIINRIAEEMQDAIMQVRMMPVSFVFQRFPRLVRDISRKLGKEVNLHLEGEDTEADKNIIEALGDPLVHIVRNSLDHGFELPDVRIAGGKPAVGTLTIRASQEADRVVIDITDDGKGIDPKVVRAKALAKGLIDDAAAAKLSDAEAVNLVFAAGFSTADVISDLSGRGVGMDVVRTTIERVNGTISLESEKGKGTRLRLALPLSMAVTNVIIVESNGQIFGVPMDYVVETVRLPRTSIRVIKSAMATVLRGRIIPLKSINTLLDINAPPMANDQDELAVLVVRIGDDMIGLLVDDFRETVDIILKPLSGVLQGLLAYSGSALMGDGSVLLVLNVKELM